MITVNEVYRKIKEMSAGGWNPRPALAVQNISRELRTPQDHLLPLLSELQDMKLIRFDDRAGSSIKLTLLGNTVTRTKP